MSAARVSVQVLSDSAHSVSGQLVAGCFKNGNSSVHGVLSQRAGSLLLKISPQKRGAAAKPRPLARPSTKRHALIDGSVGTKLGAVKGVLQGASNGQSSTGKDSNMKMDQVSVHRSTEQRLEWIIKHDVN